MRKFSIAAALSVMVFAIAAFAASFVVNDTVLASGEGDVTNCGSEDLTIISWGAEVDTLGVHNVVFSEDDLAGCDEDEVILVQVHNEAGNEVGRSGEVRVDAAKAAGGAGRARVSFLNPPVPIEHIDSIRVVVHTKTG